MNTALRQRLLRINAIVLGGFGVFGLAVLDIPGACCQIGALGPVIRDAPSSAIGFIEAHGLAIIIAALLFRASQRVPDRSWHLTAAATHLLLGTANIVFWDIFDVGDVVWLGVMVTVMHFVFTTAETVAALAAGEHVTAAGSPGQ